MKQENARSAIARQKDAGKTVIGCFPLYPPVELFSAMGLSPVVLWNLKADTPSLNDSDQHLQNYACGIARELIQFIAMGAGGNLDGFFSYNACDTLRNLPEIVAAVNVAAGRARPMLRMHVPQANRRQTDSNGYLKNEISQLITDIEKTFAVNFVPAAFRQTVSAYAEMRKLCLASEQLVAQGALPFTSFCGVVLAGYFLPVAEQIANLADLIDRALPNPHRKGKGVLVSGIMPPPLNVMQAMETCGLRVVANDIASLRRSYGYSPGVTDHPGDYYIDFFNNHFPCTTLLYQTDARAEAFIKRVESSGARGVIFSGEKFCEHEYFEFPYLEKRLKEKGIPVLRLEFGVDDRQHTKAYITRVEAFSELLA